MSRTTDELEVALDAALGDFVDAADAVGRAAGEVAALDARLRAARAVEGVASTGPDVRMIAADVLHASAGALRPSVPFVSEASGDMAREALMTRYEKHAVPTAAVRPSAALSRDATGTRQGHEEGAVWDAVGGRRDDLGE